MKVVKIIMVLGIVFCLGIQIGYAQESSKKEEIVKAVNWGLEVLETKGKAGFDDIKNFRFGNGEGYLLVLDMNGIMLYHPVLPQLIGNDMTTNQDADGKYFDAEMKAHYVKGESGWEAYQWLNKKSGKIEPKCSYYKPGTMDGNKIVVVGGLYGITADECK